MNTKTDLNRNHQLQKDILSPGQACSSSSSTSFSSTKSSSVSVTLGKNRQSFKNSMVVPEPPDSIPLQVHPKTDLIHSLVGLPMPRVSLEQALASAEQCHVMDRAGVKRLLSVRTEEVRTNDDLLQTFQKRMKVVRQIGGRGVVHQMESEVKWIVLGEEEEQKWFGGVVSRTRQATRKILGWMEEGGEVREEMHIEDAQMGEKQAIAGAKNVSHDNIDCDLSFNKEDWYVKKAEQTSSREDRGSSDEEWYMKTKPSSFVSADSSYFNTFGKLTRSTLTNLVTHGNLTITAVAKATVDEEKHPEEQQTVECDKDEVEEIGTCPMCQKEMEMKALIDHAGYCQGSDS